jgi:hypothetical protein
VFGVHEEENQMKKNFILTAVASLLICSSANAEGVNFTDIDGHWAKPSIEWVVQNGVVKSYEDNTFKPNNTVTEAEFLSMMLHFFPNTNKEISNNEISNFVNEQKSIHQCSDSLYKEAHNYDVPVSSQRDVAITRGQVAQMIAGAYGKNHSVNGAIAYLFDSGLSSGRTGKTINGYEPNGTLTRAEAIVFLKKIQDMNLRKALVYRPFDQVDNPNISKYKDVTLTFPQIT